MVHGGGTDNFSQFVDQLDVPVQSATQLTSAVSQLKFSPAPTHLGSNAYSMVGYRMLAASTFDGNLLVFRVDHQDDGTNPRPAAMQQIVA